MWKETTGKGAGSNSVSKERVASMGQRGNGEETGHTQSGDGVAGYSYAFEFPSCWRVAVYPEQVLGKNCVPFTPVSPTISSLPLPYQARNNQNTYQ